jgi:hypothetical protein
MAGFLEFDLAAQQPPAVWTGQYDNDRSAANLAETVLNTGNVHAGRFGLLFTLPVDGFVYAQPLYMPGVTINRVAHNVIYVATLNNTVYALDADSAAAPLWQVNLGPPVALSGMNLGFHCGILSTPVIDQSSGTIYVVPMIIQNGTRSHWLHALDVTTGQEKFGGPVQIQGSVNGTAPDGVNGVVTFSSSNQMQRPALLLNGTTVTVMFGTSEERIPNYHGWVFNYSSQTLQQTSAWCTTRNGLRGGIWMSGRGAAADSNGIYFMIGNGDTSIGNWSEMAARMDNGVHQDYFLPDDYGTLNSNDWDLGAGGPLLIPNTSLLVGGGKTGVLFVLNRSNLGKYVPGNSQVVQTWQATAGCDSGFWNGCNEIHHIAYWNRSGASPLLYVWGWEDSLNSYAFNGTTFTTTPAASNPIEANYPGGILAVSANGSQKGTGILWAAMSTQDASQGAVPGMLRAFDAVSLTELWNSTIKPDDNSGLLAKFCVPTVANGKVYLATFSNRVDVYGLH